VVCGDGDDEEVYYTKTRQFSVHSASPTGTRVAVNGFYYGHCTVAVRESLTVIIIRFVIYIYMYCTFTGIILQYKHKGTVLRTAVSVQLHMQTNRQ
jgi:hypothetical protein